MLIRSPCGGQLSSPRWWWIALKSSRTVQGPGHRWRLVGTCVPELNKWEVPRVCPAFPHSGEAEVMQGSISLTPGCKRNAREAKCRGYTWLFPCCAINGVPSRSGMYH